MSRQWHSPRTGRLVAHQDGTRIILDFGRHQGATLQELPDDYLQWVASGKGGHVPDELQAHAVAHLRARAGTETWWAVNAPGRQVAHRDPETDEVIVDFGAFEGQPLTAISDGYLGWMVHRSDGILPDDLRHLAAQELQRRQEQPRTMSVNAQQVLEWAARAPAGEVHETVQELRLLADELDRRLTAWTDAVLDDLHIDPGGCRHAAGGRNAGQPPRAAGPGIRRRGHGAHRRHHD